MQIAYAVPIMHALDGQQYSMGMHRHAIRRTPLNETYSDVYKWLRYYRRSIASILGRLQSKCTEIVHSVAFCTVQPLNPLRGG